MPPSGNSDSIGSDISKDALSWGETLMDDSKLRFSNRTGNYVRYRPAYPVEIITFLKDTCGLTTGSAVADVGSGTGLLSELFLESGYRVFGVEPNKEMREAAEYRLGDQPGFESVASSAESTTLPQSSVDLVVAGNSFHWVDPGSARTEFSRVLKPGGRAAIVWNVPKESGDSLLESFQELLSRHRVREGWASEPEDVYESTAAAFFGAGSYERASFSSSQSLDLESFKGLVHSYSIMPAEEEQGSVEMVQDLEGVFRANESGGRIVLEYVVYVYCGIL